MRTLLIDNYDSFTYNLFQLLAEVNGTEPLVVRNDESSWDALAALELDNIVVSPGPGRPDRAADFGLCARAIAETQVPLLGVCLGHQGIGLLAGAAVVHAPEPMHGRVSAVLHDSSPLFAGMPRELRAVRYHSLCVELPLPRELEPLAWTSDGVLMALAHRRRPLWGVQFHPESIGTAHGRLLLANFRDLTIAHARAAGTPPPARARRAPRRRTAAATASRRELHVERLDADVDPERAFLALYGGSPHAFWLDSSSAPRTSGERELARFSFMGAAAGPSAAVVTYDVTTHTVRVESGGIASTRAESIFDFLARETGQAPVGAEALPFAFDGGFVGYLGYEVKADCGGACAHAATTPDAAFIRADRLLAFDHVERAVYVLAVAEPGEEGAARSWIDGTARQLRSLPRVEAGGAVPAATAEADGGFALRRSPQRYREDIARCRRWLADGETYEICLTNTVAGTVRDEPLAVYRRLRRVNPAPFAAFLRFGETAVLSSSPERFLSVGRDRWAEARPIKGTAPRGATPAQDARLAERLRSDEKTRAENLMITDLLRNDLGMVCEVGTVHVPSLMHVETYATLHQLVSSVRGLLRPDASTADCVRACFPGGSMTGAPKRRTMALLDELEGASRGVYAGALGWFGLGGACDLSIVIRTIVLERERATIGAGGAIVMQSDEEAELHEMLLKAQAPLRALGADASPSLGLDPPSPAPAAAVATGAPPRDGDRVRTVQPPVR